MNLKRLSWYVLAGFLVLAWLIGAYFLVSGVDVVSASLIFFCMMSIPMVGVIIYMRWWDKEQ